MENRYVIVAPKQALVAFRNGQKTRMKRAGIAAAESAGFTLASPAFPPAIIGAAVTGLEVGRQALSMCLETIQFLDRYEVPEDQLPDHTRGQTPRPLGSFRPPPQSRS